MRAAGDQTVDQVVLGWAVPTLELEDDFSEAPTPKLEEEGALSEGKLSVPSGGPSDVKAKKCKNCKKWYAVDEVLTAGAKEAGIGAMEDPYGKGSEEVREGEVREVFECHFHTGVFRREGQRVVTGMHNYWSCCKDRDINAPGCTHKKHHVEDRCTTAVLEPFVAQIKESPFSTDLARRIAEGEAAAAEHEQNLRFPPKAQRKAVGPENKTDDKGNLVYAVQYNDTIQGLALRFGVTTQQLKQANGLIGDHIACYPTLIIPQRELAECTKRSLTSKPAAAAAAESADALPSEEQRLAQERRRAAARTAQCRGLAARMTRLGKKASEQEASSYLAMAEEDEKRAFELYLEDLAWESSGAAGPDENFKKMLQECVLPEVLEGTPKKRTLWKRLMPRCIATCDA